jgi:hypothetical protein
MDQIKKMEGIFCKILFIKDVTFYFKAGFNPELVNKTG